MVVGSWGSQISTRYMSNNIKWDKIYDAKNKWYSRVEQYNNAYFVYLGYFINIKMALYKIQVNNMRHRDQYTCICNNRIGRSDRTAWRKIWNDVANEVFSKGKQQCKTCEQLFTHALFLAIVSYGYFRNYVMLNINIVFNVLINNITLNFIIIVILLCFCFF